MNAMVMNDKGIPIIETWQAMKQRHFNEKVEALRYMADNGLTTTQASKVLDCMGNQITRFISHNKLDIKFKLPSHRMSGGSYESIAKKLTDRVALSKEEPRLTCKEAAKRLGMREYSLREYSRRHSIKWKPPGSPS